MRYKHSASRIYIVITLVVLVGWLSAALLLQKSSGASSSPDHITLTWRGNPATSQTITWRTGLTESVGKVKYIEAAAVQSNSSDFLTVVTQQDVLSTNLGNMTIHSVTLDNLRPGVKYIYQVGDGAHWSRQYSFVTASSNLKPFKFLVFGDSQGTNYLVWRAVINKAYQVNPDAAFAINVGDLVDVGLDYREWKAWFNAVQGIADTIPIMPLAGNHETYTPDKGLSMPLYFMAQFKLPDNGPEGLKGLVYSFDYGDMHFSMLDSQENEERNFVANIIEKQKEWLDKDLKATNKHWKVVFIHRPPFHNRPQDDDENLRDAFVPIIDKHKVDIVFSGHDHVYARSYPLRDGAKMKSPAEGSIYITAGRTGTKTFQRALAKEWNEVFYNPQDEPNYLTVDVKQDTLTVKAVRVSGGLIDEFSIIK